MGLKLLVLNWRDVRSPEAGGSEFHLHEILKRTVQKGHEVTLVCSRRAGRSCLAPEEIVDGVRVVRVGSWWDASLRVPRRAKELLEEGPCDLVVDDVNKVPFFAPRWSDLPVSAVFHHLLGGSVFFETNWVAASVIWLLEKRIGRVYGRVPSVAVSGSTAAELAARGFEADCLTIVPPGLDHDMYKPDPSCSKDAEAPIVAVLSRLKRYKRVDVAIRAMEEIGRSLPGARMVVIGDGNVRPKLKRLASRRGINVEFLGRLPAEEKVAWLQRASLVLNPSYKEGWGLVGIEAMACGTPVIASDVPGHRDSVPKEAGVLVPYGDHQVMAREALRLLGDQILYSSFREAGLEWAKRFQWDDVASRVIDVWERAVPGSEGEATSTEVGVGSASPTAKSGVLA